MGTVPLEKETRKIFTVSELTSDIRSRLESAYPFIWLTGEVTNLSKPSSGHIYFSLKDPDAQIAALMFKAQARQLRFQLQSGLRIIGFGRISVYPPRGSYQIILEYAEPMGTGSLQLAFEQLKLRLHSEGLFDKACKKPLPLLPTRISLVTSPSGAVIHDMLKVLHRRYPTLHVEIVPVRVQGEGAAEEMVEALHRIQACGKSDLVVLARGGGSLEDLSAFNSETLARAIFASPLPVVTGIGHETDFTIADFVADVRASTPTAAAETAVPDMAVLQTAVLTITARLGTVFQTHLRNLHQKNRMLREKLLHPKRYLTLCRIRLDDTEASLLRRFQRLCTWKEKQLSWSRRSLSPAPLVQRLHRGRMLQATFRRALSVNGVSLLQKKKMTLEGLHHRLQNLSPFAILERGYAVARKLPEKRILNSTDGLVTGDSIEIQLAAGILRCRIEEMDHGKEKF